MNEMHRKLWPFTPRGSIFSAIGLLVGLLLVVAILRTTTGWPSEKSEAAVLIGVLLLSLLPVLLSLLDVIIERGAIIEYRGVKIDFSQVRQTGISGAPIPANIGIRGQPVTDSSTTQILDALRQATASEVVIIDLEQGQAWWETRLLVLLAGADRLGKPERVVFVGTDAGKDNCFQGWAYAKDLLRPLAQANRQYLRSLMTARAAAKQWELVEPVNPAVPGNPGATPAQPPWVSGPLATQHPWMAFDANGLPNKLLAEQLLASDLGEKVETPEQPTTISLVRLDDLFRPVLYKDSIDQSWPADRQLSTFFGSSAPYFAVTENGQYLSLVSRVAVLSAVLRSMVEKRQAV